MNCVKELRRRAGMQQKEVALAVGVSRPTVSEWEHQKKDPSEERLLRLAELFNVSTGVILGYDPFPGSGTVYPPNVTPVSNLHTQRVPMIGYVAAGQPIYDPEEQGIYVDSPIDADAAITVRGDSMEPTYLEGDIVYIKCCPDVHEGAVAVLFIDDEATIKHVYKRPTGLTLISDNRAHAPIMVEFDDYSIRIFGVPVGYTRIYKPSVEGKIKKGLK